MANHVLSNPSVQAAGTSHHASKLMLLPNLAYNAALSFCNSSRISPIESSSLETSASIPSVEDERRDWASSSGRLMKVSPIL